MERGTEEEKWHTGTLSYSLEKEHSGVGKRQGRRQERKDRGKRPYRRKETPFVPGRALGEKGRKPKGAKKQGAKIRKEIRQIRYAI